MGEPKRWVIVATPEADAWLRSLSMRDASRVSEALDLLHEGGPMLGRRHVDRIKGSRLHNMKELRPTGGNLRVLFAFDRENRANMLVGGDKTGQWKRWYARNIPRAERLSMHHQQNPGAMIVWRPRTPEAGR